MTGREILEGFAVLQRKFPGRRYRGADLNPVWPQLLACSRPAFERTVGILIKHARALPPAAQVLEKAMAWEKAMRGEGPEPASEEEPRAGEEKKPEEDPGAAAIRLMQEILENRINLQAAIEQLYRMSESPAGSEYAEMARRLEARKDQQRRMG
jgi:hypothetical protein